jgi:DNA-directed RNA polymerase subunit M/transcription elongation factor TFIIS
MNEAVDRLVVAATFLEPNQAHVVRSRLEAEGIRAALDGEHHISMDWLISNAIGGVKLLVHERDLESAKRILQETCPSIRDEETGDETDDGVSSEGCPCCGSNDVCRERLKTRLIFLSILLLGIPLPFLSRKMVCETCGHKWRAN